MTTTAHKPDCSLDVVIDKLASGSEAQFARMLGLARSTVNCWRSVERRGEDMAGVIPQKYHRRILDLAREKNVELSPLDLVGV